MPQQEANEPEEASNLLPLASPDSTAIQSPVHLLEAKSPSKTLGSNFRSKKSASLIILTAAAIVILLFHSKTLSYFLSTYFSSCDSRKSSSWIAGNSEVSSGEENSENEHSETDLDFAVIGFPKTGEETEWWWDLCFETRMYKKYLTIICCFFRHNIPPRSFRTT